MNCHGDLSPGVHGRGEGQVGQSEDDAALDESDAVAVMILQSQPGFCPAAFRIQQLNPHEFRKEVSTEKGFQRIGSDHIVQVIPPCYVCSEGFEKHRMVMLKGVATAP